MPGFLKNLFRKDRLDEFAKIDGTLHVFVRARVSTYFDLLCLERMDARQEEWALDAKLPGGQRVRCPLGERVDWKREVEQYETVSLQAEGA